MTLRHMVDKGWVPGIETFDTPSPGFVNNTEADRRTFPGGYTGVPFRNLLRDDFHPEQVQASPDPRDFVEPGPGIRSDHAPLPVEGESGSVFSDGRDQLGHQPGSRSSDSEGQAELGAEGEHAASGSGMPLDW